MIVALPLIVLLGALLLGVPIAIALAAAGMLGIFIVTGDISKVIGIVSLAPYSTVAEYALTTIPMFILMAYFSASSGLARDLYTAAAQSLSHIRGGLAMGTVFACGIFGAMSGASVAAASVMAKIAMPEMRRHGYSDELAAGSIGVGATLDILIPPSIAMVIYGVATQTSIGKLLIAGIVPGLIVGALLIFLIWLWVRIAPHHAPETFRVPLAERRASYVRVSAEPAADHLRRRHAVFRHRDAERGRCARRIAGRHHRRGVRPADAGRRDRRVEVDAAHLGDDLPDPDRGDDLRLLHDAVAHPARGRGVGDGDEPQPLGRDHRHRRRLFRRLHVHGRDPAAAADAAADVPADHPARVRSDLVRRRLHADGVDGARVPAGRAWSRSWSALPAASS